MSKRKAAVKEDIFEKLERFDCELSDHLKCVLTRLKYTSVKSLSMAEGVKQIETLVKKIYGKDSLMLNKLSTVEKESLLGDFADDPSTFTFFPGEANELQAAIETARKLVETKAARMSYDDVPNKKRKTVVKTVSTGLQSNNQSPNDSSGQGGSAGPGNVLTSRCNFYVSI